METSIPVMNTTSDSDHEIMDSQTTEAANTVAQCNLCEDIYPEKELESHLVGVHGVDGPIEKY